MTAPRGLALFLILLFAAAPVGLTGSAGSAIDAARLKAITSRVNSQGASLVIEATEDRLDAIARAFAWVIDAKSDFTYKHSERVADIAVHIAEALGFAAGVG